MKVVLIPLAGRGKRFTDEGYPIPKPLIPINGVPMVVAAAKSLPPADKYIFLCLKEHIKKYHIDKKIKDYFPKAVIVPVNTVTEGQASTCLLAEPYIQPDDQLTIGACDNGMAYQQSAYDRMMSDPKTDAIIWTFRNSPNVKRNPDHWGWVAVDKKHQVKKVSVKKPLSNTPMQDHAVVGCFSFKKATYFFENVKKMIAADNRINNEFYNDACMNVLIKNGLEVKVFEIDTYVGWGTPADLKTYEYWKEYFKDYSLRHPGNSERSVEASRISYRSNERDSGAAQNDDRKPQLSIVLPFYNEKQNIKLVLNGYAKFSKKYDFELICVNNGSTDGSEKIFQEYAQKKKYHFMRIVSIKKNKGYGHGIMTGVRKATADVIAWTHADMQTHPGDVFRAYEVYKKEKGPDVLVKGSRKGRNYIDTLVSFVMACIATLFLRTPLFEINAQPKLFPRSLVSQLSKAPDDFLLDLFLLHKAKSLNYTIRTITVQFPKRLFGKSKWAYSFRSRLRMIGRTIRYIIDLSDNKPNKLIKAIFIRFLFMFLGLFIGILCAEGAIRFLDTTHVITVDKNKSFAKDAFIYSPTLKYKIKPYLTRDCTVTGNPKATCHANAYGFRDTDHAIEKPSNTYRIVLLGDSLTYGPGVNFEESYPGIFEQLLKKNSKTKIEVIKLGMIFYSPQQYYYMYKEYGRKYDPDLVIVSYHLLTDPFDAYDYNENRKFYLLKSLPDMVPHTINQPLKEHSYLWRALLSAYYSWANKQESKEVLTVKNTFQPPKNRYHYDTQLTTSSPAMKKGWEQSELYLEALETYVVSDGAKMAIVAFPPPAQVDPDEWEALKKEGYLSDKKLYSDSATRKKLSILCKEHKWNCLDLQENLRKAEDPKKLFLKGDIHYTKEGNDIAAKAIYKFIKDKNILKQ